MLNKLFGSLARVKILKIFLTKPKEKFYIRQLARDLNLQVNSVRRELENLEKFGLLTSEEEKSLDENSIDREDFLIQSIQDIKGGKKKAGPKNEIVASKTDKKYYRVDKDFVLFEEIRALILKSQVLYEKDFVEKIYKAGKPKLLILTGFFVNHPEMSVDLLAVGKFNRNLLLKIIQDMELEMGREINYTIMGMSEFVYRRDMTDVFLYNILEKKNIKVIDELS